MKTAGLVCMMIAGMMNTGLANDVISAKVVSVINGNTLEVIGEDNETRVVKLAGIDTPELSQEYGDKARKFLTKLVLEKNVTIQITGKDRKGTNLAIVTDENQNDLRVELLKEGLAWTAERNPTPELEALRVRAQEKGKGLWKQDSPTPPWIYRRQQSMMEAKGS